MGNTESPGIRSAALLAVRAGVAVAWDLERSGPWPPSLIPNVEGGCRSVKSMCCTALTPVLPAPQTIPAPGVLPLLPPQVCRK